MCDLLTAGVALSAVGSVAGGLAGKSQADFQAAQARNNAIILERKAEDARARGSQENRRKEIQTALLIGQQRVDAAANGVLVDFGSVQDLTEDTAAFGRLDALTILNNAEREALGFEFAAANSRAEADLLKKSGTDALFSGILSAGATAGTLLGTAPTVNPKWNPGGFETVNGKFVGTGGI